MSAPPSAATDPFGLASTPSAYVPRASTDRALQSLDRALRGGRIPALVGPPGLGKTLLLQRIAARVEHRTHPVYIPFCSLSLHELCALVLGFEEVPPTDDPVGTLSDIAQQLKQRGLGLLLLVDDAAMMPPDTAKELADYVASSRGAIGVALAAIEGPEASEVLDAFGEQIEPIPLDAVMTLEETHDYVTRRLAIASANEALAEAFHDEVIEALHLESLGVPRSVNVAAQRIVRSILPDGAPDFEELVAQRAREREEAESADIASQTNPAEPEAGEDATEAGRGLVPLPGLEEGSMSAAPAAPSEPSADRDLPVHREESGGSYRVVRGQRIDESGAIDEEAARVGIREELPSEAVKVAQRNVPKDVASVSETVAPAVPAARTSGSEAPSGPGVRAAALWERVVSLIDGISRRPLAAASTWVTAVVIGLLYGWMTTAGEPAGPTSSTFTSRVPGRTVSPAEIEIHRVGVNATPWALIEVDGIEIGETPIARLELPAGPHTFRAYMPDGRVREKVVIIDEINQAVSFD